MVGHGSDGVPPARVPPRRAAIPHSSARVCRRYAGRRDRPPLGHAHEADSPDAPRHGRGRGRGRAEARRPDRPRSRGAGRRARWPGSRRLPAHRDDGESDRAPASLRAGRRGPGRGERAHLPLRARRPGRPLRALDASNWDGRRAVRAPGGVFQNQSPRRPARGSEPDPLPREHAQRRRRPRLAARAAACRLRRGAGTRPLRPPRRGPTHERGRCERCPGRDDRPRVRHRHALPVQRARLPARCSPCHLGGARAEGASFQAHVRRRHAPGGRGRRGRALRAGSRRAWPPRTCRSTSMPSSRTSCSSTPGASG
jgi:hypothetical protein